MPTLVSTLADPKKAATQVSISITYGEQKTNKPPKFKQANQASQIQAGGKTTLLATGASEQSNINITGSDVAGKAGTILIADNQIHLQSAEQTSTERSQNKSAGWNVGAAVSFGQGGWSLQISKAVSSRPTKAQKTKAKTVLAPKPLPIATSATTATMTKKVSDWAEASVSAAKHWDRENKTIPKKAI